MHWPDSCTQRNNRQTEFPGGKPGKSGGEGNLRGEEMLQLLAMAVHTSVTPLTHTNILNQCSDEGFSYEND